MTAPRRVRPVSSVSVQQSGAPRLGYVRGIDGLRALSVLAVLGYHADVDWLPGGFLGVEVFFVISGFLITVLLAEEWDEEGRISLRRFWSRRARRLLPALFALLAATSLVALTFARDALSGLKGDVVAALAYFTNWRLIYTEQSYFEAAGRPPLLRHLWSLAIEEQFYVLWPLTLAVLLRVFGGSRRTVIWWLVCAAGVSAFAMALGFDAHDPSRVYYGTHTRASGLLGGAALGLAWREFPALRVVSRSRVSSSMLALLSIGGLVWCAHTRNEFDPFVYRFGFLLVDLLTAGAILASLGAASSVLGAAPLRYVGTRSYGLYLWHWPVFQLTRPDLDIDVHGGALLALRLGLTFAITEVSYQFVEMPIRRAERVGRLVSARPRVAAGALATVAVLAAALVWSRPPAPEALVVVAAPPPAARVAPASSVPPSTSGSPATRPASTGLVATGTSSAPRSTTAPPTAAPQPATTETTTTTTTEPPVPMPPAPVTTPLPAVATAYSAFGDSVMLGASALLADALGDIYIDGIVGRLYYDVNEPLQQMIDLGVLAPRVLLHLGNNGVVTDDELDEVLSRLASRKRVVIATVRVPRNWQDINNERLAAAARRHRNVVIADWFGISNRHPDYFRKDGYHLSAAGADAYTALVVDALTKP